MKNILDPKLQKLIDKKQFKQLSLEWYDARKNIITASSAATLLTRTHEVCDTYVKEFCLEGIFEINGKQCNPYEKKIDYIKSKSGIIPSGFTGNDATNHGQKFEQIANDIYSIMKNNMEIFEFGLILHDSIPWLGASPDGIASDCTMLEIKCPFRRKINGIPPLYYWIQVQLQLEVCDLEYCDFFECEFITYYSWEEFIDDILDNSTIYYKGIIFEHEGKYIYPDKSSINNIKEIYNLIQTNTNYKVHYWKLSNYSNVKIKRSREWFANVKPLLEKDFNYIQSIKNNNTLISELEPKCIFK